MRLLTISTLAAILLFSACGTHTHEEDNATTVSYPETRKDTTVVDDYFGTKVASPFNNLLLVGTVKDDKLLVLRVK
ncbi:MAG: hypothetical protein QF371_08825 [Flavobacteriales bacterium]|jgi:hypothetical protein|nr:hypothetical protein [Flavobacteriales bacterium]